MRHVTMNIDNYILEDAGYAASIEYWKDDNAVMARALISNINDELSDGWPFVREEFNNLDDALNFLQKSCAELVASELEVRTLRGRRAQERLDEINENGFKL